MRQAIGPDDHIGFLYLPAEWARTGDMKQRTNRSDWEPSRSFPSNIPR